MRLNYKDKEFPTGLEEKDDSLGKFFTPKTNHFLEKEFSKLLDDFAEANYNYGENQSGINDNIIEKRIKDSRLKILEEISKRINK